MLHGYILQPALLQCHYDTHRQRPTFQLSLFRHTRRCLLPCIRQLLRRAGAWYTARVWQSWFRKVTQWPSPSLIKVARNDDADAVNNVHMILDEYQQISAAAATAAASTGWWLPSWQRIIHAPSDTCQTVDDDGSKPRSITWRHYQQYITSQLVVWPELDQLLLNVFQLQNTKYISWK